MYYYLLRIHNSKYLLPDDSQVDPSCEQISYRLSKACYILMSLNMIVSRQFVHDIFCHPLTNIFSVNTSLWPNCWQVTAAAVTEGPLTKNKAGMFHYTYLLWVLFHTKNINTMLKIFRMIIILHHKSLLNKRVANQYHEVF